MNKKSKVKLPKELEIYRTQIERTVKPVINITTKKKKTGIYQSKFAGYPYFPKNMEYPRDTKNKPMKLLAQLNFEDMPTIDNIPNKGILQFFISAEDKLRGMNMGYMAHQKNFKIIYHEHIVKDKSLLVSDFSYLDELNTEQFPIKSELALSFQLDYEPVSIGDFKIDELLGDGVDLSASLSDGYGEIEYRDFYYEAFSGEGHKIGGYPYFTQDDPRSNADSYKGQDVLLLQIDSDYEEGIMWGYNGVANFFIKEEDLLNLEFSNVIYNWDSVQNTNLFPLRAESYY